MQDYTFPTQLLGCAARVTVRVKAQIDWDLDPELDGFQMRLRAERLALGVLTSNRAKAGDEWGITIVRGNQAEGHRRITRRRTRGKPREQ